MAAREPVDPSGGAYMPLIIREGVHWPFRSNRKDGNGDPIDGSGQAATWQFWQRDAESGEWEDQPFETLTTGAGSIVLGADGSVKADISDTETAGYDYTRPEGWHELEITDTAGKSARKLYGPLYLKRERPE